MMRWVTIVQGLSLTMLLFIRSTAGYLNPYLIDLMVTDSETGHVYTAERDILVHRYPNLTVISNVSLTSDEESIETCKTSGSKTNVSVTAMALDSFHPRLLVCSTFCDGLCAFYNISDISQRRWMDQAENGSYIKTRSAVVFLKDGDILVGSSRSPSTHNSSFPILSRRHISVPEHTTPAESIQQNYKLIIRDSTPINRPAMESNFSIRFISGFDKGGSTYFLTVQKDESDINATSRLIRISSEVSVVPFIEIPLHCETKSLGSYTLAIAMDLSNKSDRTDLLVSFGQGMTSSELVPDRSKGIAFCGYNMGEIDWEMNRASQLCEGDTVIFTEWLAINTSTKTCWHQSKSAFNQSLRVVRYLRRNLNNPAAILHVESTSITLVSPNGDFVTDDTKLYIRANVEKSQQLMSSCETQQTCDQCVLANSLFNNCSWCHGCHTAGKNGSKSCIFDDVQPKRGPESGGTTLTFSWCPVNQIPTHIGICESKSQKLETIRKCEQQKNSTTLTCSIGIASPDASNALRGQKKTTKLSVCIKTQEEKKYQKIEDFTFEADPTITSIRPKESIESGGLTLTVRGRNFDVIQRPRMGIYVSGRTSENTTCTHTGDPTVMYCPTPPVNISNNSSVLGDLYFIMDGVRKLLNLKRNNTEFKITLYGDPVLEETGAMINLTEGERMNIKGQFDGVNASDVEVEIGSAKCQDVETNVTTISCMPEWEKAKTHEPKNVTVKIGKNVELHYGRVQFVVIYKNLPPQHSGPNLGLVIGLVFILAVIILVTVTGLCIWVERRKRRFDVPIQSGATTSSICDDKMLHAYFQLQPMYQQKLSMETIQRIEDCQLLIPATHLKLGAPIGAGNFGCVYIGQLYSESTDDEPKRVAVKTMHDNNQSLDLASFVEEALIMKGFNHVNVLQLLGISVSDEHQPMVVLPFMANGDLMSYVSDEKNEMQISDVLKWGTGIAEGMNYLSGLKLVHRDLAARNCMLDDDLCVKVADFGLCRDIYEKGYYTSDNKKKLPIRWMAPESMERGNYSSKSDVWSLGVVIWELLTRGATPYPGVEGWDIARFLHYGRRLQQPWFCSGELYDMMLQMWSLDPSMRPTFSEISEGLSALLKTTSDMEVTSESKDDGYVRFPDCCRYVELPVPQYFVLDAESSREQPPDDNMTPVELT